MSPFVVPPLPRNVTEDGPLTTLPCSRVWDLTFEDGLQLSELLGRVAGLGVGGGETEACRSTGVGRSWGSGGGGGDRLVSGGGGSKTVEQAIRAKKAR